MSLGKGGEAIKGWLAPPPNRIFFLLIFLRKINRIEMIMGWLAPPHSRGYCFLILIFQRKINMRKQYMYFTYSGNYP
jgi:hypothetical protein